MQLASVFEYWVFFCFKNLTNRMMDRDDKEILLVKGGLPQESLPLFEKEGRKYKKYKKKKGRKYVEKEMLQY